ncbi:MAG: DUF6305 family protein [Bacilli bacterium]
MKKLWILLSVLVLSFIVVGCKPNEEEEEDPTAKDIDIVLATTWQDELQAKTVYLTTCGQADIDIIRNVMMMAGILDTAYTQDNMLTAAEVEDDSVVILVVGTSGKGLGAAGTNVTAENTRAEAFATKANSGKIELIVVHIGGTDRRGELSDTIIGSALAGSDLTFVVITGDADDFFTDHASDAAPLYLFSTASKLVAPFKVLFGIE